MDDNSDFPDDQPNADDTFAAAAMLRENAIEMYVDDGHPQEEAERLADELLAQPVECFLPVAVGVDWAEFAAEDTPEEFLGALEIELEDMTDEQKRIVDAGNEPPAGTFPTGLSRDELREWITRRFGV